MKLINGVVLICCLIASTSGFSAGQEQDVAGSKDHPLISRYTGSWIIAYGTKAFDEYLFATGKLLAEDKLQKSEHLEGKITRITYQAPQGRSSLEIYRNFESALKKAGFQILFSCAEQDCADGIYPLHQTVHADVGDSIDTWAGQQGWGLRHVSAKLSRPEGDVYVSLLVQNGNDAQVVQLDVIEMKPMDTGLVTVNAATLAGDINRTGHASVYGIYFDTGKADVKPESETTLKEIAKLLQQQPDWKLYVVGHTDNQGAFDMNMDLSRRRADAVIKVLTDRYAVGAARLRSAGDGPTAPVASNETEESRAKNRRVELVKQ